MVPELLSSNLCSLRSNVDRWEMKTHTHTHLHLHHSPCCQCSISRSIKFRLIIIEPKRFVASLSNCCFWDSFVKVSYHFSFTRLAFSCIWEMNHEAEILKTRFTKSVINSKVYQPRDICPKSNFQAWYTCLMLRGNIVLSLSCPVFPSSFHLVQASLTYAEAQMRIDDTTKNDDITKSLRGLNKLAKILKKQRIEKG